MDLRIAAYIFSALVLVSVLFQLALAGGAPWGEFAMGGRFPGRFPPALRIAALVQAAVLLLLATVVLTRAKVIFPGFYPVSAALIWVVVAVSGLSLLMNSMTPSKRECFLWAPVSLFLTICGVAVAVASV